jgi:pimeloyl-ACP methyl ester carboxylesterase
VSRLAAHRRRSRGAALVTILLPLLALASPPAAGAQRIGFSGGTSAHTEICGQKHRVETVDPGTALTLRVGPRRGGRTVVRIDRCTQGRWKLIRTARSHRRSGALVRRNIAKDGKAQDLRARVRGGRPAYARVGVGEIVDIPFTTTVANQNRTSIPCLGAPDGKTYPIHGALVAPRSALEARDPAVTLYVHGLGYSSFFFHFEEVPGYDYAEQQARSGHASVVIDRLGNPAHDDLPDGNATCIPAQADMTDQVIAALRAGNFELDGARAPKFRTVLLAGHSAGGFIAQIDQYSFESADALAVISYTDLPSPLAVTTFFAAGQDCLTAPQRAHGDSGAPNYAPFGRTDADFAAGHFHDIDPEVERIVLERHNRDACGDLMSALQALIADQVFTRTIQAPVLVISGTNDALFSPPANRIQAAASYPSSSDVDLVELPDTGHAVTLGRSHKAFTDAMNEWLSAHGG